MPLLKDLSLLCLRSLELLHCCLCTHDQASGLARMNAFHALTSFAVHGQERLAGPGTATATAHISLHQEPKLLTCLVLQGRAGLPSAYHGKQYCRCCHDVARTGVWTWNPDQGPWSDDL